MTMLCARFNIYFLSILMLLCFGCKTSEEKKRNKEATTLRLHIETNQDGSNRNSGISVFRDVPTLVNIELDPFLNEGDVEMAAVVPAMGGYAIRIQFNKRGAWILENTTTSYKGRRIAIFSQFGDARWLGAPVISQRITNGTLMFTPDASLEEAERIVRGLNNVAAGIKKRSL
jgi:preprotein translocase subunit SecD